MKKEWHRPPHIFIPNSVYFVSENTYNYRVFSNRSVGIIADILHTMAKRFSVTLHAWVILPNHYHILFEIESSEDIPNFIKAFHSKSSILVNKAENTPGTKNFYQYRDKIVEDENYFYTLINYIHYNPVHHQYVKEPGDYKYSSYSEYLERHGQEWLDDCINDYPLNESRYN